MSSFVACDPVIARPPQRCGEFFNMVEKGACRVDELLMKLPPKSQAPGRDQPTFVGSRNVAFWRSDVWNTMFSTTASGISVSGLCIFVECSGQLCTCAEGYSVLIADTSTLVKQAVTCQMLYTFVVSSNLSLVVISRHCIASP